MSGWWEGTLIGFDLESSGVDVFADRIVTASIVKVEPGCRPIELTWLVDPGVEIPAEATAVHGVTTGHARKHGMPPEVTLSEVTGQLAMAMLHRVPVVAFNAAFDFSLLEAENRRHGVDSLASRLDAPIGPIIDPHVLDKQLSRRRGSRKLVDVCGHYRVTLAGAHSSAGDALAAVRLVRCLAATFPQLRERSAGELHADQVEWRAEQMVSLRGYFDGKGIEHDGCDGLWPVRQPVVQGVLS